MQGFYIDCPKCDGENESCYKCEGEGVLTVDASELPEYAEGHKHEAEIGRLAEDAERARRNHADLCRLKPEMAVRYREMLDETIDKINKLSQELWEKR